MIITLSEGTNHKSMEIASHYSPEDMRCQLMEELAELSVAVNHDRRKNSETITDYMARYNLMEETADVIVMLERMCTALDLNINNIESVRSAKLDREMRRIHLKGGEG